MVCVPASTQGGGHSCDVEITITRAGVHCCGAPPPPPPDQSSAFLCTANTGTCYMLACSQHHSDYLSHFRKAAGYIFSINSSKFPLLRLSLLTPGDGKLVLKCPGMSNPLTLAAKLIHLSYTASGFRKLC